MAINSSLDSARPGKWLALTFDDGYQDFADAAWPLLQRYGFSATVFLVTDHVGGHAEWDREYGEPRTVDGLGNDPPAGEGGRVLRIPQLLAPIAQRSSAARFGGRS